VGSPVCSDDCYLAGHLAAENECAFFLWRDGASDRTALLIAVGVSLDTIGQIESHLIMRHYEGFMKKSRIKGRWFNVR